MTRPIPTPMWRRLPSLWWEVLTLSWRCTPGLTVLALVVLALSVVAVPTVALTLRATVDATATGASGVALACAVGVAVAHALTSTFQTVTGEVLTTVADRTGRMGVHPRVHRAIASVPGIAHLERGDVLDRVDIVRRGTGQIGRSVWNVLLSASHVCKLLVTVVLLGAVHPLLLSLIPLAAVPLWTHRRGQVLVRRAEVEGAENHRLQQNLFETVSGVTGGGEARVSGADARLDRLRRQAWRETERVRFRARARAAAWTFAGWLVFVSAFAGGIAVVIVQAAQGTGTVGDLVLTVMLAVSLGQTVRGTVTATAKTAGARRVVEPYLWLRDHVAGELAREGSAEEPPDTLTAGLAVDGVSFTYPGTSRPALDGVSARLPAGSVVAVVGEYGSGKTTLVKLLLGLYRPDSGAVLVEGRDLAGVSTERWRARCSAAFQDFGRFEVSFGETVGIGDLDRMDEPGAVARAVREADAEEIAAGLPQGVHTQLGRRLGGVELSEGQWQRAALARASMRRDPLLFVLDEPTASLDAPSEESIFRRYMERARAHARGTGTVTVVVSHRFSTVAGADLVLVMEHGRVVEAGTHAELVAGGGRYARLYGIQERAYTAGT